MIFDQDEGEVNSALKMVKGFCYQKVISSGRSI